LVLALDSHQASVAEAVRIRDALDPLLIEDALWYGSPADIAALRHVLADMETATKLGDATAFARANWALHARIADVSPNDLLRRLYLSLLEHLESHLLEVVPLADRPLPDYISARLRLHADLVDALDQCDAARALALIAEHNTASAPHANLRQAGPDTLAAHHLAASSLSGDRDGFHGSYGVEALD
jgi:DNA-binding GntR family transcriptional regulator